MERYIGLDLGTTTLGIAISDSLGIVHGHENYNFPRFYYKLAREHVLELAAKEGINNIVIGYPLNMSGDEGERAKSALRFKDDLLSDNPSLNIFMEDERLTTVEAYDRLNQMGVSLKKQKEIIDMISAVIILESYLNKLEKK